MDENLLSLIIPIFNEEENIKPLIEHIHSALKGLSYEVILVDDCSTDSSVTNIQKLADPKVHLVQLKKNYGQSLALAAGFEVAQGVYLITMDGDLQNLSLIHI